MKKLLALAALCLAAVSLQAREGFYVGGEAGVGFLSRTPKKGDLRNIADDTTFTNKEVKRDRGRFVGGAHVGYIFDIDEQCTIAPQIGYRYVQRARFRTKALIQTGASATPFEGSHQLNVIDLLAVGTYRINATWDVQGKIGAAFVMDKIRVKSLPETIGTVNEAFAFNRSKTKKSVRPEIGIGVGYLVNDNMRISLDAAHIFGSRSRVTPLDTANTATTDDAQASQEACYNAFRKVPSLTSVTLALQYMF